MIFTILKFLVNEASGYKLVSIIMLVTCTLHSREDTSNIVKTKIVSCTVRLFFQMKHLEKEMKLTTLFEIPTKRKMSTSYWGKLKAQ